MRKEKEAYTRSQVCFPPLSQINETRGKIQTLEARFCIKNLTQCTHWVGINFGFGNDPSAGSPTETLLRLLLPLNDQV